MGDTTGNDGWKGKDLGRSGCDWGLTSPNPHGLFLGEGLGGSGPVCSLQEQG